MLANYVPACQTRLSGLVLSITMYVWDCDTTVCTLYNLFPDTMMATCMAWQYVYVLLEVSLLHVLLTQQNSASLSSESNAPHFTIQSVQLQILPIVHLGGISRNLCE